MTKRKIAKKMAVVALSLGLTAGVLPISEFNPITAHAAQGSWAGSTISVAVSKSAQVPLDYVYDVKVNFAYANTVSLNNAKLVIYKGSYNLGDILPSPYSTTVLNPMSGTNYVTNGKSGTFTTTMTNMGYADETYTAFLVDGNTWMVGSVPFKIPKLYTDTVAPTITLTPNTTATTSNPVTITFDATDDKAGIEVKKWAVGNQAKSYFASNGTTTSYSFSVNANGTYTAYAKDRAGNETVKTITVSNIVADTTPPTPASFTASTAPTKDPVSVTINYPGDAVTKQYRIGSGSWTTYTSAISVTNNDTVYARSADSAGNWSSESSYIVNNIDTTAPTQPTASVNGNQLTITAGKDASGISRTEYQLNDGSWLTYTGVVTLEEGQYTINVRSIDNAGNVSSLTQVVANVEAVDNDGAVKAVVEAERTHTQAKLDVAQAIVSALPESQEKSSLQQRLDVVKENINLFTAIQSEITSMNNVLNRGDATSQIVQTYKERVMELRNDVNGLPDVLNKSSLHQQLDELMAKLTLIEKILVKDDGGIEDVDLGELEEEVNNLPDGDLKDQLQEELDQAKDLQDAVKKVETAESTKSQSDVNIARDAVSKLPDGEKKNELNHRLDSIQKNIDDVKELADKISDATDKVEQAEGTNSQIDVDTARDAVNQLPNGQIKDDLNDRLDVIQDKIDNEGNVGNGGEDNHPVTDIDHIKDPVVKATLLDVERYVEMAEKYNSKTWIVSALNKVEAIPSSIKSNPIYTAILENLTNRVNKLKDDYNSGISDQEAQQKVTIATNYVTMYEKYKTSYYKTKAQSSVDALPDGDVKTALQDRIDAV